MPETGQPKLTPLQRALKVLPRIIVFFAVVTLVAWTLRWTANVSNENPAPAGPLRGAKDGRDGVHRGPPVSCRRSRR